MTSWYLLKGVDVDAGPHAGSVVMLGASIRTEPTPLPTRSAMA